MREVISLHVGKSIGIKDTLIEYSFTLLIGQAGVQIGNACWELVSSSKLLP
jgi:hypothetical protein